MTSESIHDAIKDVGDGFHYLIMSMNVYNILEDHPFFRRSCDNVDEISTINKVGSFKGLSCYVDLYMSPNQILLSWDKETVIDINIDNILIDVNISEIKITIP